MKFKSSLAIVFLALYSVISMAGNKLSKSLGEEYSNLEIMFSIDGLHDDLNGLYRRKVNTQKAIDNMIAFSESKSKRYSWQYLIFEHNWFEIPELLDFAKLYKSEP